MARNVEFWGKTWDKKRGTYVTKSIRFKACKSGRKKTGGKCPRATPNPAAQRADVGPCKPVSGSPKVSLCKVKSRGGGQWKFFKKNIKRKPGVVRRGRRKGKR